MNSKIPKNLFTEPGAWNGNFYEFAFNLPQTSEPFVNEVLAKLWSLPALDGCYLKNKIEPEQQKKCSPLDMAAEGHLYGVANLQNGKQSCCGTFWGDFEGVGCWVTFYIPLGSLENAYEIGSYPFKMEK